ncbi:MULTISPECIES: AMP-binding protein [Lactobacillaceae]|uniref:AMP-binding protein n=1 Tax=Lactobacillaceae TaxID=33958 RepID=UPI001456BFA4|nr:AMP-binding protein [Lactobacillus sp. HBUAS51381]NLR09662.1 AMP-binding protein [Lactobacillus sp. HBUAS51381]
MSKITLKLAQQLKQASQQTVIKDEARDRWFTGAELAADVDQLEDQLRGLRVGHGDRVYVCLPNSALYPVLTQAIWAIGAVMHPVAPKTPAAEMQTELAAHDYAAIIVGPQLLDAAQVNRETTAATLQLTTAPVVTILRDEAISGHVAATPTEEDLALILNTSGTTGQPKRVGLTHELLRNGAAHDIASHRMTAADTTLIVMPLFHINAQVMSLLSTRLSGGRVVITPKFSASRFWPQVQDNGVTWVSVVPTIINILLLNDRSRATYDQSRSRLRFVRCSSFSLPLEKLTQFQETYHTRIMEGYGMTETASQCTLNPYDAPKVGSVGKPVGTDVAIVVNGQFVPNSHETGEIAVRGDHVIHAYLDPHPDSFQDGWFLTGDLGYFDADGYLFVSGRKKDIISVGGEKVAPAYVENELSELSFIKEVTVIGTPDDLYGEAVTAVIISQPGDQQAQRQAVLDQAQRTLAPYEQPKRILFVQDYPRNATGKVVRPKLRQQVLAQGIGEGA